MSAAAHPREFSPVRAGRRAWRPLLDRPTAIEAREIVYAIADALYTKEDQKNVGPSGDVLLFGYLAADEPAAGWSSMSAKFLDRAVARLADEPAHASLHRGFVREAWAVEHFEGAEALANDPNTSIDGILFRLLQSKPWPGHFELVSGLTGLGIYFLERIHRRSARACLSLVVDRLAEEAEARDGGITWLTKPSLMPEKWLARYPNGSYSCGVAHGAPAVAVMLAGACRAGVNVERARPLLDGAIRWILATRLDETSPSTFCARIDRDGRPDGPTGAAWCYGDPGVATALLTAARAVGNDTWAREALGIARRAALRPMDESGVKDASLCHGSGGLALLYNRMWQMTGDERLKEAALRWYARTLELRQPGTGVAGYLAWAPIAGAPSSYDPNDGSFLTGSAGVALSLLAGISRNEPAWDVVLAVSLPVGVETVTLDE